MDEIGSCFQGTDKETHGGRVRLPKKEISCIGPSPVVTHGHTACFPHGLRRRARPFLPEVLEVTSQVLEPHSFVLLLFFFSGLFHF